MSEEHYKIQKANLNFNWLSFKAKQNQKKHQISFVEATTVFLDPLAVTIEDTLHSEREQRFIEIGWSKTNKILVVVYRYQREMIHIISARSATRSEKKSHQRGNKRSFLFHRGD